MDSFAPLLVVDDDREIREMLTTLLADEGYEAVSVADGLSALAFIEQRRPSLIILDLLMPVMDGMEFLRVYRMLSAPRAPVVVLSANAQAVPVDQLLKLGASGLLAKPFRLSELLDTVERYALRMPQAAPGAVAAGAARAG